jgi:hypothetical protein
MAAPGTMNKLGISTVDADLPGLDVPVNRFCGSRHDMGSLALFLVANWFVNGETVLIDGGVSTFSHTCVLRTYLLIFFAFSRRADAVKTPFVLLEMYISRIYQLTTKRRISNIENMNGVCD